MTEHDHHCGCAHEDPTTTATAGAAATCCGADAPSTDASTCCEPVQVTLPTGRPTNHDTLS